MTESKLFSYEFWLYLQIRTRLKSGELNSLIRILCTYTVPNPTRRAIFEFDKLVHGIYTLRSLRDPQMERNVHRSQNHIESYHQLRSTVAQVGGKKELPLPSDRTVYSLPIRALNPLKNRRPARV